VGNRSARRRCSFRRKREENIGAYDNAYNVVVQRKCHCFFSGTRAAATNIMPRYRMTLPLSLSSRDQQASSYNADFLSAIAGLTWTV
jgi:hypothetical protein